MSDTEEVSRTPRKKAKKERAGSMDAILVRRAYGDEFSWAGVKITDPDYSMKMQHALNWASATFDAAAFKRITLEYMKDVEEYAFLKDMPDYWFIGGVGPGAYLRVSKAPMKEESDIFFKQCLENLKIKYTAIKEEELKEKELQADITNKLTAEQSAKLEYVGLYSFLDNMIRENKIDNNIVYDILRSRTPTHLALRSLMDHYTDNVQSCDLYAQKKLSTNEKKFNQTLRSGSQEIVAVLEKVLTNVRAENKLNKIRKPSKKKIKPAQMQIKNLKFKESDSSLKLVSIPPSTIIAAPTLVTFNCKTRKVAIYYAKNTDGLSVKGTTIQNFDAEKSKTKSLRKPEELIEHLIGTSLNRFEKVFLGIKAKEGSPNGRINEETLLLKVFKV